MSNSGSSANLLMVAALRFSKKYNLAVGDEVLVPAVSWSTSYYPLQQYGCPLRFVDVSSENYNLDLEKCVQAITPKTKAILAVNLLGNPNDFARLKQITKEHNLILIEDNCESMGASFAGKQAGTFGVMGSFSCFFSHHISTMEGGLTVTDDEELYHIMLSLRAHGWTRNLPEDNQVTGQKYDDPFLEHFRFILPGYNVRPIEMSGAIGIEQIKKLPKMIQERRDNANRFRDIFGNQNQFLVQQEIGHSSWFGFGLIINPESGLSRGTVIQALKAKSIENRPIVAGNFTKAEVMKFIPHTIYGDLSGADLIDKNGFFVGNHHYSLEKEIKHLYNTLKEFL